MAESCTPLPSRRVWERLINESSRPNILFEVAVTAEVLMENSCSAREEHAPAAYRNDSDAAPPRPAHLKMKQPCIAQAAERVTTVQMSHESSITDQDFEEDPCSAREEYTSMTFREDPDATDLGQAPSPMKVDECMMSGESTTEGTSNHTENGDANDDNGPLKMESSPRTYDPWEDPNHLMTYNQKYASC